MAELDAVLLSGSSPSTAPSIAADLRALGVPTGGVVLVHSSLRSMGWVCGGEVAVLDALLEVIGKRGTLVMPAHSSGLSDPRNWKDPPVPEAWWPVIRDTMPPFDPKRTPTCAMGRIAEAFRAQPETLRSNHPSCSFAAHGPHAQEICAVHELADPFGDRSPLGILYGLDARVLLLGVGHDRNTSLHLAERRAFGASQRTVRTGAPITLEGRRIWKEYEEPEVDSDDFTSVGDAFENDTRDVRRSRVGQADVRLMPQRALVDYAVSWLRRNRGGPAGLPEFGPPHKQSV